MRAKQTAAFVVILACSARAWALGEPNRVVFAAQTGAFSLVSEGKAAPVCVDSADWPGVARAVNNFAGDVKAVSGSAPTVENDAVGQRVVLIGTIGRSKAIDALVAVGKLDVSAVRGQWEASVTEVVPHPFPGVESALVIAGADKRGTIFGVYGLSEQMGVSPWTWWADVPVPQHSSLYVLPAKYVEPAPRVKYRGIFLNDEAPALTGWAKEKFGGKNHLFYEHVFELLLRLRANYLWPAMWDNAFNEDDPADPKLADEYGIVMGTSHHEPMLRAQQEWKRHGTGEWDYTTNAAVLDKFWTEGIRRNREYESTITIGMRGDGDMAMSTTANTALLERIVANQRKIIAENADPAVKNPQLWALYKEVQEYYEKGMRVPDDVTLLWCDDNWGNIRRLPTAEERKRPGGAGIYYHFDYVGGPRSYKWLLTYNITKVWEQMHMAAEYGADRVWIVNVGDLKPMEFPIEFFITMARDPERWGKDRLQEYTDAWATREFGPEHAKEVAQLMTLYTQYNSRRKPEQLEPTTYSLTEDREADRVYQQWHDLVARSRAVEAQLPAEQKASYFELVGYPLEASATVGEMYIAAGRNRMYAKQGRASTNMWAEETRRLFAHDAELSDEYNNKLLNGKWNHMMDQTHIGYTFWNEPPLNKMPALQEVQPLKTAALQVFGEGSDMPAKKLPMFDAVNRQEYVLELAPMGTLPVSYKASTSAPWIRLSSTAGEVSKDTALTVSVDWSQAPLGMSEGTVSVTQPRAPVTVVHVSAIRQAGRVVGAVESAGVVSLNAESADNMKAAGDVRWEKLPRFGETVSGMETFPVTAASTPVGTPQACMEYRFTLWAEGNRELQTVLAPTLPFIPGRGLRYSVAIDKQPAMTVDVWERYTGAAWSEAVSDGVRRVTTPLGRLSAGTHTLQVCRVDPGVVVERLAIYSGKAPATYLGPPESKWEELGARPRVGDGRGPA